MAWLADLLYGGRAGQAPGATTLLSTRRPPVPPRAPDGVLALPVLGDGERTDADLRAAFTGLSQRHGRGVLARAMLEGAAFAIRGQLELLRGAGAPATELRVSGGDTRLGTWNRIKADVTGLPVRPIPGDAATPGVAMLAGLGAGVYRDLDEAIARCVRPGPAIEPAAGGARHIRPGIRSYAANWPTSAVRPAPRNRAADGTHPEKRRSTMRLELGINTCFAVKRWPLPGIGPRSCATGSA